MAAWPNNSFEAMIGAVGTASLGDVILKAAETVGGVDEVFGFWIEGEGSPMPLASSGHRGSSRKRASLYSTGFHALDPLLPVIRALGEQASVSSASLRARQILDPVYRRECFDRPGLFEKIAFVRTCGTRHYVLSFYRTHEAHPGGADRLNSLAEFSLPILKRHAELLGDENGLSLTQRLEYRLARAYTALTKREREVCARSLTGMTAEATALDLGIAETSVLTYRRRAYERYSISSVGQLLEGLLG